jgi:hypothetical protein
MLTKLIARIKQSVMHMASKHGAPNEKQERFAINVSTGALKYLKNLSRTVE